MGNYHSDPKILPKNTTNPRELKPTKEDDEQLVKNPPQKKGTVKAGY